MRKRWKIAAVVLLLILTVGIVFGHSFWGVNPLRAVTVGEVAFAVRNQEGSFFIGDNSGKRLIKVRNDQTVEFIKTSSETDDDKGFYIIKGMASGADGSVYIIDQISAEGCNWISKEVVKRILPGEGQVESIYERAYAEEVFYGSFLNLQSIDGSVYLMEVIQEGVYLRNMSEPEQAVFYPYEGAYDSFRRCQINPQDRKLYVMLDTGQMLTLAKDGSTELFYDREVEVQKRIPWSFAFDSEGILYMTDIWNREICLYSEGHFISYIFAEEMTEPDFESNLEEAKENYVYYQIDADFGLTTCTTDYIGWTEGDEFIVANEFSWNGADTAKGILFWLCVFLAGAFLLAIGCYLLWRILAKGSQTAKISLMALGGTLVITMVFSMITIKNIEDRFSQELMERAKVLSEHTAKYMPTDALKALREPEDYSSPAYREIRDYVHGAFIGNDGVISDMYCVIYSLDQGVVMTRYMMEETGGCAYVNEWESSAETEMLETGESQYYIERTSDGYFAFYITPVYDENGEGVGIVEVGQDMNMLLMENQALIRELYVNVVALAIVMLMIFFEVLLFLRGRKSYAERRKENKKAGISPDMFRILVFCIFFIINISSGFMAIYATKLAAESGVTAVPKEILAAVPISLEVLTGALFSLFGSFFVKHLGQKRAALFGGGLFTVGLLLRFVPNLWTLSLGSAVQGCGWGIVLLIVNVMIANEEDQQQRESGFSGYNIACQNGVNAGVVFGGFLLNWLNYQYVFLAGAILSAGVLAFVLAYFGSDRNAGNEETKETSQISFLRFLFAPRVFMYFVGILFPIVAGGYFLNYLYPVLGEGMGMTETNISYTYLLNSLCIMCFGGVLTRLTSKRMGRKPAMVLASAIYALTFALVAFYPTIPMLLAALVLLGISDSFGMAVQSAYFTELPEVKQYGYEKSMGVTNLVENLAETGGSFIFGYILVMGLQKGLLLAAGLVLILAVLFAFVKGRKKGGVTK